MYIKTNDNINLYVNREGEGLDCIYVHGGPGAWSKDFEKFCGIHMNDMFNITYLDQRGCGRSEGEYNSDYSIDRLVEDIEEVRVKLNIQKFIIIAHSFGGIIATSYASKYGENLEGIILINCTLDFKEALKSQIKEGCNLLGVDQIDCDTNLQNLICIWKKVVFNLVRYNMYYMLQFKSISNYEKLENLDKEILNTKMSELAFENKNYFIDYTYLTKSINIPTLIITGSEDYAVGIDHHESFEFENSIIKTINGRHTPYIEDSSKLINIIKDFVSVFI